MNNNFLVATFLIVTLMVHAILQCPPKKLREEVLAISADGQYRIVKRMVELFRHKLFLENQVEGEWRLCLKEHRLPVTIARLTPRTTHATGERMPYGITISAWSFSCSAKSAAFSPDGKAIVVLWADDYLGFYDALTGQGRECVNVCAQQSDRDAAAFTKVMPEQSVIAVEKNTVKWGPQTAS